MPTSDHHYKGYIIRLKMQTNRGGRYQIYKECHGKVFMVLERAYMFIPVGKAIWRGCNYIDNFEDRLKKKLKELFIPYAAKVATNPDNYKSVKGLDVDYYCRMHKKLTDENPIH